MKLITYIIFLVAFCNFQYIFGQKDTLFINHLDTVRLNIDQPFIPVICCMVDDSITEIIVYFHLTTNSKNLVVFNRVHSGGGSLVFGNYQGKKFEHGELHCQSKHILPKSENKDFSQKRGVQFIFLESVNDDLHEINQRFTWIGGRKSQDE